MITKAKLQKLFSNTESYHTERTTSKMFKVVENSSSKYSELGFGAETSQENIKENYL